MRRSPLLLLTVLAGVALIAGFLVLAGAAAPGS